MSLKFGAICPHPPLLIPTIGRPSDFEKISQTKEAMEKLAKKFYEAKLETVIVISPHAPIDFKYFIINTSSSLRGNFSQFGDNQTNFSFKNDLEIAKKIENLCQQEKIPLKPLEIKELDHGILVPLFYLLPPRKEIKVLPLSFSCLDRQTHFLFGKIILKAIQESPKNIGLIASGDLSHCLLPEAPVAYSPLGKEFDEKFMKNIEKKNNEDMLNLDENLVEGAAECGYRSSLILLGALEGLKYRPEVLSYEAPFGVGYPVINFRIF